MSILGPNNIYTVHGMLQKHKHGGSDADARGNAYIWVSNTLLWNEDQRAAWSYNDRSLGSFATFDWNLTSFSKLRQHHGVVEILRKLHLARSEAVQWSWSKREPVRTGGTKGTQVNVCDLNEAPPWNLAFKLTMSDGKGQSSEGQNDWLLGGVLLMLKFSTSQPQCQTFVNILHKKSLIFISLFWSEGEILVVEIISTRNLVRWN